MIRPPRLRPGDRLAALTASWGGPDAFPHRYEAGVRQLEAAFGVEVVELPGTSRPPSEVEDDPVARATDLHTALRDPSVAGIVSTIGGDDAIRVVPHVVYDEVLRPLDEAGRPDLTVVTGVDIGRTDPMWTVPLDVQLRIDPRDRTIAAASGVV